MSPFSKKLRNLLIRKHSIVQEPTAPIQEPPRTPEIPTPTLPILPPEILLQIIELLPFKSLWFIRGTCQHWNSLAFAQAWQIISKTFLVLDTTLLISGHGPSMRLEHLFPINPDQTQQSSHPWLDLNKSYPTNTTIATWRVKMENPFIGGDLTYSYKPSLLHVLPRPPGAISAYEMESMSVSQGRLGNFRRMETWSTTKRRSSIATLFSRKGSVQQSLVKDGPTDPRLDWSIQYLGEYKMDPLDQYPPMYRLRKLTLLQVSLPISQLVCLELSDMDSPF
jgi:hypothetical protein